MLTLCQVFYSVGTNGLIYTYCVLAADVTNLRNRGLAFAFTSSPYMITAFAGSKAAEGFLLHVNWRWGFGAFAIIFPCVCAPLFTLLKFNEHKAKKQGLLVREKSGLVTISKIWKGIVDFDRKYNSADCLEKETNDMYQFSVSFFSLVVLRYFYFPPTWHHLLPMGGKLTTSSQ